MIGIGASIGSGIFVTPADTIQRLPHYGWALLPWLLGGIAAYCGGLTFAELGASRPKAGGVYVYLKEAYGDMAGFLYGWCVLLVINTGALAALGIAFSDYMTFFYDLTPLASKLLAICVILGLSAINSLGVDYSDKLVRIFTGLKLTAMLIIIGVGIWALSRDAGPMVAGWQQATPVNLWSGLSGAFIGVFWSIGGWHHISYVSSEAINPGRDIPRALLLAVGVITLTYLTIIAAYMAMLPMEQIIASKRVAGDAVAHLMAGGGKMVAIFIAISIFGTIAIYTMSAPRIYYAMAKDKVFFEAVGKVHLKFNTPANAIFLQAVWACILVLIYGSFMKVIAFVTFMDIAFMSLTAGSIFVFRYRNGVPSVFHVKWFPWLPLVYLIISLAFVFYTLLDLNEGAIAGCIILLVGIFVYRFFRTRENKVQL